MLTCSIDGCDDPHRARGWCTKHYQRWASHGDPTKSLTRRGLSDIERFWFSIEKTDDCWYWTGALTKGYAVIILSDGSRVYAHRLAYEVQVGPIPEGMEIDHLCHTTECQAGELCPHRRCVRGDHLAPANHYDNMMRGTGFAPMNAAKTHCPHGHPYSGNNLLITKSKTGFARRCRTCKDAARLRSRVASQPV